jgi:hypothetical protein
MKIGSFCTLSMTHFVTSFTPDNDSTPTHHVLGIRGLFHSSMATQEAPSILLDADAHGNKLFDCTRDDLKPVCRLGSLIARV